MIRIALLLFVSFGILQAAHKPDTSIQVDEETYTPSSFSPHKVLPQNQKPNTSSQVDEKTPLLKNTKPKTSIIRAVPIISAVISMAGFAGYGVGYLLSWLIYRGSICE